MKSLFVKLGACMLLAAALAAQSKAPAYAVDRSWPKPFPDKWVIGGLGGLCVDAQDHVFLLNRQDVTEGDLNAGQLAPPIIEIDSDGNLVHSWGDPKLLDSRLHSCYVDKDNNIWIASAPSGMLQKYSHDGSKLLLQIGKKGVFDSSDGTAKGKPLNSNAAVFYMPSSIFVDPGDGDVYLSDGEGTGGNRRIAVMDAKGAFLRQWQPEGMQTVHCMSVANDGQVYVCNRDGGRLQVYDKQGNFKKNIEIPWTPVTAPKDGPAKQSGGAAVSLELSRDPAQRLMFLINQNNARVEIIERETGKILGSFGRAGHFAGEFDQPHGIAVDSKGNVYVAENRGRRVQKFRPEAQTTAANGDQQRHYFFAEAGRDIPYRVYVPSKYDGKSKLPMMVCLHGAGGTQDTLMDWGHGMLKDLAEKHGYIVVTPLGYSSGASFGQHFNIGIPDSARAGGAMTAAERKQADEWSEKDVMNVTEMVAKEYTVDRSRVYLMGHSRGALATWYLGEKYRQVWAGIAPVAGGFLDTDYPFEHLRGLPVIVSQGSADAVALPERARAQVATMEKLRMSPRYVEVAGATHGSIVDAALPGIFDFFDEDPPK